MNAAWTHRKLRALLPRSQQRGFYFRAGRRSEGAIWGRRCAVLPLPLLLAGGSLSWLLLLLLAFLVGVFRGLDRIDDLRLNSNWQNGQKHPDSTF